MVAHKKNYGANRLFKNGLVEDKVLTGLYPLKRFLQNLVWWEGVPGPHLQTKFHRSGFKKCGFTAAKMAKIAIFGINLPNWPLKTLLIKINAKSSTLSTVAVSV